MWRDKGGLPWANMGRPMGQNQSGDVIFGLVRQVVPPVGQSLLSSTASFFFALFVLYDVELLPVL